MFKSQRICWRVQEDVTVGKGGSKSNDEAVWQETKGND